MCSHYLQRRLGVVRYARWHWILLLVPFSFSPFRFESFAIDAAPVPLAIAVFIILFTVVSLPFLTPSMTSLILQRWLSVSNPKANPYVLYSISNLGSWTFFRLFTATQTHWGLWLVKKPMQKIVTLMLKLRIGRRSRVILFNDRLTKSLGWHQRVSASLPAPWTDQFSNVLGAMLW